MSQVLLQRRRVGANPNDCSNHVCSQPFVPLRLPMMINLRQDPFERAHRESMLHDKWGFNHLFVLVPAQAFVGQFLQTFIEFPPRQKPGSFSLDRVMEKLQQGQPR